MTRELQRAVEQLHVATRLLEEFGRIGLWIKADDCSDNWRRRRVLREAGWEVWGAADAVKAAGGPPDIEAELRTMDAELRKLREGIPDTMLDLPWEIERPTREMSDKLNELRERIAHSIAKRR